MEFINIGRHRSLSKTWPGHEILVGIKNGYKFKFIYIAVGGVVIFNGK